MTSGNVTSLVPMKTRDLIRKISYQLVVILIVIQISLAVSWGWTWMLFLNPEIRDGFLKIATVTGSAVLTGVISRAFLKEHLRITRWLCSIVSLIFSMVGLFYLSNGQVGFSLSLVDKSRTNLDGIFQILLGGVISWLVLNAWKKPRIQQSIDESIDNRLSTTYEVSISAPLNLGNTNDKSGRNSSSTLTTSSRRVRNRVRSMDHPGRIQKSNPIMVFMGGFAGYINGFTHWIQQRVPLKSIQGTSGLAAKDVRKKNQITSRKKHLFSQRASITLLGVEEHRCPYCLETVDESKEVVVECTVCHTIHHKSCWEITGTCQVPHIHS